MKTTNTPPALSRILVLPVSNVDSRRFKATGDNNEKFVATDAAFKEFNYEVDLIFHPPAVPELVTKVVDSVEDCRWNEPLADQVCVWFGEHMPTINDDKDPKRDVVNFPRPKKPIYPEGTRLIIFPDSWFRSLYEKTGVTGPYVLVFSLGTFLFSKEWLLFEHEMLVGCSLAAIFTYIIKTWGDVIGRYFRGISEYEEFLWNQYQTGMIDFCRQIIQHEKDMQESLGNQDILFEAKKENVALQREAEYRRRLHEVYLEVKRKLDYQVANQNEQKVFAQRHMVKWILDAVQKGVAQTSEKETLNKCVSDLKALAQSRSNAI